MALSRFFGRIGGETSEIIRMRDGTRLLIDSRSRTENGAFWTGNYETEITEFLKRQLVNGSVFFDVGANIGFITVGVGAHVKRLGGKVYAFEPVHANFQRLKKNIALNDLDDVTSAFNFGLGDEERDAVISLENANGATTGNAVLTDALLPTDGRGATSTIEIKRLDSLLEKLSLSRVDLVKVDIEGAEVMFLRGARQFIERFRPTLFGEFNQCFISRFGHSILDADRQLGPLGYRPFRIEPHSITPVEHLRDGMQEIAFVPVEKALVGA